MLCIKFQGFSKINKLTGSLKIIRSIFNYFNTIQTLFQIIFYYKHKHSNWLIYYLIAYRLNICHFCPDMFSIWSSILKFSNNLITRANILILKISRRTNTSRGLERSFLNTWVARNSLRTTYAKFISAFLIRF
jgi:hypothetical protein